VTKPVTSWLAQLRKLHESSSRGGRDQSLNIWTLESLSLKRSNRQELAPSPSLPKSFGSEKVGIAQTACAFSIGCSASSRDVFGKVAPGPINSSEAEAQPVSDLRP
jgi:hypothetical protein